MYLRFGKGGALDPDAGLGEPLIYWDFETPGEGEGGGSGIFVNQGSLTMTGTSHGNGAVRITDDPYAGTGCCRFDNGAGYFLSSVSDTSLDFNEAIIQYAIDPMDATRDATGPQMHFAWDTDLNNRFLLYMTDKVPTLYLRRGGGTAVTLPGGLSAVASDDWSLWRWEILGGNITLKINGSTVATVADPGAASGFKRSIFGDPLGWGRVAFAADAYFQGRMDEFKFWRVS